MALKECSECGQQVSTKAGSCPHCGITNKQSIPVVVRIGLIILLLLLIKFCQLNQDSGEKEIIANDVVKNDAKEVTTVKTTSHTLDYSKPLYTTRSALICPRRLVMDAILDNRVDHGMKRINDLYTSIWNRDEKIRELGCEEWKKGIRIYAKPTDKFANYIWINEIPEGQHNYFTMEIFLTNNIDNSNTLEND